MIRENYKKVLNNWSKIASKKQLASQVINRGDLPIRKGIWVIKPDFSYHYKSPVLPPPLDKAKRWGDWRKERYLKLFIYLSKVIIYPWFTYARKPDHAQFNADVVLINRLNEPIGFDLSAKMVLRLFTNFQINCLEESIKNIRDIYPCAPFLVDYQNGYVYEKLISGSSFVDISSKQQVECVKRFFQGLKRAKFITLDSSSIVKWRTSCRTLFSERPISNLSIDGISACVNEFIAKAKTTWVHGDLYCENIIFTEDGPVTIDFDKAGIAPSFTDIFTLFVFEARSLRFGLMNSYLQGGFDREFDDLGCRLYGRNDYFKKISLFIAWLGWKMTTEEFSPTNLTRLLGVLDKMIIKNG